MTDRAARHGVSDTDLEAAAEHARQVVTELEGKAAALAGKLDAAREEVQLFTQLLALRRGDSDGDADRLGAEAEPSAPEPSRKGTTAGAGHPVVLEAMRELAAAGHPLHISELMDRLRARSVTIPGAGKQANLIAHMTRSEDIVRPKRGMYALATWDLPEAEPLKRSTRRRVRGPSKSKAKG